MLSWRPVLGVIIDKQRITLSVVAKTPFGRKEISKDSRPYDGQSPEAVLRSMLEPWVGKPDAKKRKIGPWVQVALPDNGVFQTIVPITESNRNSSPQAIFLEAVQASNVRAEDRVIDLLKLDLNKSPLACVAACPRATIESMVSMMNQLGARVSCVESSPPALYRAGNAAQQPARGSKLCVRFFLGRPLSIGILGYGTQPLCWHTFELPNADETKSILAAFSTLWMVGRHSRITMPIDSVVVHGLPELNLDVDAEGFRTRTGAQLFRSAGPVYDASSVAFGAALADPVEETPRLDLARDIKPAVLIRDVFPWGELVVYSLLIGAMSLFLAGTSAETHAKLKSIEIERSSFPWLSKQDQAKLDAERKALDDRLAAAESFRNSRVNWSGSVRTVASSAPDNTVVKSLTGNGEVESPSKGGKTQPKKQMIIKLQTPAEQEGVVPQEIDKMLIALRSDPNLKKHFPMIDVDDVTAVPPNKLDGNPMVAFRIVCLPKKAEAAPAPVTKKAKAAKG
jgi:hypothetical protein